MTVDLLISHKPLPMIVMVMRTVSGSVETADQLEYNC